VLTEMAYKIITCQTVGEELKDLINENDEMISLEFGLHDYPDELNKRLQAEINRLGNCEAILLGYGLCSKGAINLVSSKHTFVIPKRHDCIGIFLGSHNRYLEQHQKEPGTYYLTKGWIKYGGDPFKKLLTWRDKYGDEKAFRVIKKTLENYTRLIYIQTGNDNQKKEIFYAEKVATMFGLKFVVMRGDNVLLKKMVRGVWDENFIVVEPGGRITLDKFMNF
jgi:hypothetical protein